MRSLLELRWATALRRAFHLDRASGNYDDLGFESTVLPTYEVTTDCAEWAYARGERLFSLPVRTVAAGGAATYARTQVSNPAAAGFLLVVKRLCVMEATAGTVYAHLAPATAGAVTYITPRDSRLGTATLNGPYLFADDAPAASAGLAPVVLPCTANVWLVQDESLVVAPGAALMLITGTANEAFSFAVQGYEVPLSGGESS